MARYNGTSCAGDTQLFLGTNQYIQCRDTQVSQTQTTLEFLQVQLPQSFERSCRRQACYCRLACITTPHQMTMAVRYRVIVYAPNIST